MSGVTHHIVLIPGFLGFGNLGDLRYFVGVREALEQSFRRHRLDVRVHEVQTLPTGSIRQRSARVLEALAELGGGASDPIHLIGHSTGGLDARMAIAPTASLPVAPSIDALQVYRRVETLVAVSTPHYGTPLADVFGSTMGRPLLGMLAATSVMVLRKMPLTFRTMVRLGGLIHRFDDLFGQRHTVFDELYHDLLADFSDERRSELIAYIEGVSQDQSLVFQLTAAGCDILNGATGDPDHARYGSVVTRAPAPRLGEMIGLRRRRNVYARGMHGLYATLYAVAARSKQTLLPVLSQEQEARLCELYGDLPALADNDGIVPTRSQVWGEVIHATHGDHLDTIGHFGADDSYASDWLPSGSRFARDDFHETWDRVADFIAEQALRPGRATQRDVGARPELQPTLEQTRAAVLG